MKSKERTRISSTFELGDSGVSSRRNVRDTVSIAVPLMDWNRLNCD